MSNGQKIPRARAIELVAPLAYALDKCPGVVDVVLAGSIRRLRPEVGDADITIFMNGNGSPPILWSAISSVPHKVVRGGTCEKSIVLGNELKVELRIFPESQRGAALLFSTGSGEFNRGTRTIAKSMGMLLNQYGLWTRDRKTLIAAESEQVILEALDLPYFHPQDRDDRIWKYVRRHAFCR